MNEREFQEYRPQKPSDKGKLHEEGETEMKLLGVENGYFLNHKDGQE